METTNDPPQPKRTFSPVSPTDAPPKELSPLAIDSPARATNDADYNTDSPGYAPLSPARATNDADYNTDSPGYAPLSPARATNDADYNTDSPGYAPNSPARATNDADYNTDSPGYAPNSPGYATNDADYNTDSPGYAPNSPEEDITKRTIVPVANIPVVMDVDETSANLEKIQSEYYDSVTLYYNYKQQYERSKEEMRRKIGKENPNATSAEKRKEYLKKKHKCINCGRNVGTIFATELRTMLSEDDYRRTLVAKCGDKTAPCNLDIQISMPFITLYDDMIEPTKIAINEYKKRIILIKNDVMFGYAKENVAIQRYIAIGQLLSEEVVTLEDLISDRDIATKEHQKRKQLSQAEELLEKDIDEFARLTKAYTLTRDEQLLKDSTRIYTDHILKTAKIITDAKYGYSEIEYDEDTRIFKLVQKQFPLNITQNYSGEEVYEIVMKFVKGDTLLKYNKTLKKAKAKSASVAKNKSKTRKQKTRDARIKQKTSSSTATATASDTASATESSSEDMKSLTPASSGSE
jgi:hypothetical protein